jgi:hypothetical protein
MPKQSKVSLKHLNFMSKNTKDKGRSNMFDKEEMYIIHHFDMICVPNHIRFYDESVSQEITKKGRENLIELRDKLGIPVLKNGNKI